MTQHDKMVWSLWVQNNEAGVPSLMEASVPDGRADLLVFDAGHPSEIVEVKFRDAGRGIPQLIRYRDSLVEYGYPAASMTLACPENVWTTALLWACAVDGIKARVLTEADFRKPPYMGRSLTPRWSAGGWCGYWQSETGYLRIAA